MNLKVYSVYDDAVKSYMPPFFLKTKGEAARAWIKVVNDKSLRFHESPKDYTLFEIGEFNEDTGMITPHKAHESVGNAVQFINSEE